MNNTGEFKLERFLNNKIRELSRERYDDRHRFSTSFIQNTKGFIVSDARLWWGDCYAFTDSKDAKCIIYCKKDIQKSMTISIDGMRSGRWKISVGMLYRCMDTMENIAKEFRQLANDLKKEEKIVEMGRNSIHPWLKSILQNQPYSYYTTESENKIVLSIKMENRMQLDIPIYLKSFQKIMPELLHTIQQFERVIHGTKIKVLISNLNINRQWIKT